MLSLSDNFYAIYQTFPAYGQIAFVCDESASYPLFPEEDLEENTVISNSGNIVVATGLTSTMEFKYVSTHFLLNLNVITTLRPIHQTEVKVADNKVLIGNCIDEICAEILLESGTYTAKTYYFVDRNIENIVFCLYALGEEVEEETQAIRLPL